MLFYHEGIEWIFSIIMEKLGENSITDVRVAFLDGAENEEVVFLRDPIFKALEETRGFYFPHLEHLTVACGSSDPEWTRTFFRSTRYLKKLMSVTLAAKDLESQLTSSDREAMERLRQKFESRSIEVTSNFIVDSLSLCGFGFQVGTLDPYATG